MRSGCGAGWGTRALGLSAELRRRRQLLWCLYCLLTRSCGLLVQRGQAVRLAPDIWRICGSLWGGVQKEDGTAVVSRERDTTRVHDELEP